VKIALQDVNLFDLDMSMIREMRATRRAQESRHAPRFIEEEILSLNFRVAGSFPVHLA
jgi:hypothetical protein